MRPAGKAALESLYFDYPLFPFRRPPELDGSGKDHPVIIAGAGPVGLVAALALALHGIASVVLERKNTVNDGSRAICVSRYSFETLQQLGAVGPFLAKALGWTKGRCYYRDQLIYRLEMPHSEDERFLPMYNIQQQYIEQYLIDQAGRYPGLIDLRWQSEVLGVRDSASGVTLEIGTPEGPYTLQGQYLLAADGARSAVRDFMGLRLRGDNLPGNYVIADVRMQHDFPTERRSFFESSANPEATVLVHRQPDDIWRVDWQILPSDDPEAAVREENVRARVRAILAMIGHQGEWELEWWSIYTANTLCLDDYRHGRVMFIGDSAHIVPIFGVRGLNNGLVDAVNVAWKLAYVLRGLAPDRLLDSYTPERRGATLDVFRNAGKSSRFMTPPSRGYAVMRKVVLELALTEEFTRPFADPRQVQPYTYRDSPLTTADSGGEEFAAGPAPGFPLSNCRLGENDYLLDHIGHSFTVLYFAAQFKDPCAEDSPFRELPGLDPDCHFLRITCEPVSGNSANTLVDSSGNIYRAYDATEGTLYLVRPDRYVAGRWKQFDAAQVTMAMRRALGGVT
ncbi:MAG: FAD-dependent monooxygenase [Halieaceae bacterium]|jgi:3-(3-hydroxy-phenyl)propionate hydroxylase|nr:FAD-dependent monooxygenase [Halieaceae bacterium]